MLPSVTTVGSTALFGIYLRLICLRNYYFVVLKSPGHIFFFDNFSVSYPLSVFPANSHSVVPASYFSHPCKCISTSAGTWRLSRRGPWSLLDLRMLPSEGRRCAPFETRGTNGRVKGDGATYPCNLDTAVFLWANCSGVSEQTPFSRFPFGQVNEESISSDLSSPVRGELELSRKGRDWGVHFST